MGSQLENMKYLRSIGASIKLQDDVAKKVGGYDNPLFVPTVEFIMKLQQIFAIKSQGKEQVKGQAGGNLPSNFSSTEFKSVDLDAARDAVKSSDWNRKQKKQSIKYIDARIAERDKFLDKNPNFDIDKEQIPRRRKNAKVKPGSEKQEGKKTHILSIIANAMKAVLDQLNMTNMNSRRNNQQVNQQSQRQQQNMRQTQTRRRNIASLLGIQKAAMSQHHNDPHEHGEHEHKPDNKKPGKEEFLNKIKDDPRISELQNKFGIADKELLQAAKNAKGELGANVSKELMISSMINQIVKGAQGKMDDKTSKDHSMEEAMAKLLSTGVKPISSPEQQINNKKVLADQQQQTPDQKQRG